MFRSVDLQVTSSKILINSSALQRVRELTDIWFLNKFDVVFNVSAKFDVSSYNAAVNELEIQYFGKRNSFQAYLISDGNTMDWLRHFYGETDEDTFHGVVLNLFLKFVELVHKEEVYALEDRLHIRRPTVLSNPKRAASLQKYYSWLASTADTAYPISPADDNFPFIHYDVLKSVSGHPMNTSNDDFSSVN